MPIHDIHGLHQHLQTAIQLEHATIPAYLCALYSIRPNSNREAYEVIRSIVMEEMLHMALAANVLNAVGGSPSLNHDGFVPEYPTPLPYSEGDFLIHLMKFSPKLIQLCLKIERPMGPNEPPKSEDYHSIAQFYEAIQKALTTLSHEHGEQQLFCGDPARQITPEFYKGGGNIIPVTDLNSALEALEVIIDQGEGLPHSLSDGDYEFFGQREEVAHYYRFKQILAGRYYQKGDTENSGPSGPLLHVDWEGVYPIWPNTKMIELPQGSVAREKVLACNVCYTQLLDRLHDAFNGQPSLLKEAGKLMREVKESIVELMQVAHPTQAGYHVGPSFERVKLNR